MSIFYQITGAVANNTQSLWRLNYKLIKFNTNTVKKLRKPIESNDRIFNGSFFSSNSHLIKKPNYYVDINYLANLIVSKDIAKANDELNYNNLNTTFIK